MHIITSTEILAFFILMQVWEFYLVIWKECIFLTNYEFRHVILNKI